MRQGNACARGRAPVSSASYHRAGMDRPDLPAGTVALVHDYFTQRGGAERLVGELSRLFPTATVHTSVVDRDRLPDGLDPARVRPTRLQSLRARGVPLTLLAPLLPTAFGRIRLDGSALVISSTTAFAHHVRAPEGAVHLAYCHSPPHFLWGADDYFRGRKTRGRLLAPALALLRRSDLAAASRVDIFVANSRYTADRIRDAYGREAQVIHPPIVPDASSPTPERSGRFLVVSRLRRHKRIGLAIEAATRLGVPLDIIGSGPDEASLRRDAGPDVRFLGHVTDAEVRAAMARCTALLVPGIEDFGLTMAEAQAAGRPPVAFARGGALEIIRDGETGFLFDQPTTDSLVDAMRRAIDRELDVDDLVGSARRFDRATFDAAILELVERSVPH